MDHHREIQLRADRGEKFRFFCVIVYQGILFFKGRPCLLYIQTPLNRQMKCSSSFYSIADDGWWTTGSWNNSSNKEKRGALLTTRRDIEHWNQPMQNVYPTRLSIETHQPATASYIHIYLLPYILTADCGSAKKCGQIFLLFLKKEEG